MNKKIIVIVAIVVIIIAAGLYFLFQRNSSTPGLGTTPPPYFPTTTTTPFTATPAPTSTSISLGTSQGTVVVNNFYQTAIATSQDGRAVNMENTNDYVITYNVPDSSFSIAILSTPLEAAREAAERALLKDLGISEQDACKLTVSEGVPIRVSDEYPGENFPLSFCGDSSSM